MKLKTLLFAAFMMTMATQMPQLRAQDYSVDSDIQLLRADIRNDKVKIMTDQMQLNDTESKAFWPIYNDYQHELEKLSDQRVALIKEYASNYDNMSDKEAQSLAERAFTLQKKRIDLRQQYFKKISKAVSPKSAARFAQVDDRIDLLLNLQLAANLPVINNK